MTALTAASERLATASEEDGRNSKRDRLLEELTTGIAELTTSERWQHFLDVQSRFHRLRIPMNPRTQSGVFAHPSDAVVGAPATLVRTVPWSSPPSFDLRMPPMPAWWGHKATT